MKKKLMVPIIFALFFNLLSAEIPKNIKEEIAKEARKITTTTSERTEFEEWQQSGYVGMMKEIEKSNLSTDEKKRIVFELKSKYGNNYVKQHSIVLEEISKYKMINEKVEEKLQELKKKEEIDGEIEKEKIEKLMNEEKSISDKLMIRFRDEAKRLYPNNYYEQRRYIESSISNFEYYKKLVK